MEEKENRLTPKQLDFCHSYIKSGNATEAYTLAYKPRNGIKVAEAAACRLLRNVKVVNYLSKLQKAAENAAIASVREIQTILTKFVRDDEAGAKDRIKAADLLIKSQGGYTENINHGFNGPKKIVFEIYDPKEENDDGETD